MHKKRKIIIKILSIMVFILGALGILVWGLNTVSQNKTLTSKFIHFQIERLLDLDSEVENPHAYLDWDMQYKIRADKLSFIQNNSDLVTMEDVNLSVFLPYMLLKKIYITQMNVSNLFVDAQRYDKDKINIIEIFNIKSFFDIYFRNSEISVNRYFIKFIDTYHQPEEKIFITGDNIFLSKFTQNKYLQLIADGNIDYKNRVTPFAINYNAKIPTIQKDFNFEVSLPDFDAQIVSDYVKEFEPNTVLEGKGRLRAKISNSKYVNLKADLEDIKLETPRLPLRFDYDDKFSIQTKLAFENKTKNVIIEKFNVKGKDFETSTSGKVIDITKRPLNIDLDIKVEENSNGNSIMKLIPWGLPSMNYAVDKIKKYNAGLIMGGQAHAKGKIGYLEIYGHAHGKDANLGYGFDYPSSTVNVDFKGEKLYLNGTYYPNKDEKQYTKVDGSIKIKKPFYLDLKTYSSPYLDVVSGQKALNILSDVCNFSTGPLALLNLKQGFTTVPNLEIKGTPPYIYLNGKASFWNGVGSMPGLYGEVEKTSGEVDFLGKDIVFKNIKGMQEGTWGYAHGKTEIHNKALTHFYMHIPEVSLVLAKQYIDNSPLIKQISDALKGILDPKGMIEISFVLISDQDTPLPYTEGFVSVPKPGSCNIAGLAYRATDVTGRVDFDTYQSRIDFDGYVHGVKTKLTGTAETNYSNLLIVNEKADINAAYEFFVNSPMFEDMKDSLKDLKDFNGTMRIETRVTGDLAKTKGDFTCDIDIFNGSLKYLDIPEPIVLKSGHIKARRDKTQLNNISGTVFETPFNLVGLVTDAGTPREKYDVKFEMKDFPICNVKKLVGTQIFPAEANELMTELDFKGGFVDVVSYVDKKENKSKITFNNAAAYYKKASNPIVAKSGEMFFSKDLIKFNDLDIKMTDSDFLIDGNIYDYEKNPKFNIDVTSNIAGTDFNDTMVPLFQIPISLTGKIYTNLNFTGSMDNWNAKMRAMLDDNSYVNYKNANIGAALSKFMFVDASGNMNDVNIKTLDIFSPTPDITAQPPLLAQMYGKVKDIKSKNPYLDDFHLKLNDYMNISFLNILFYNPKKPQPLLSDGKIKGNILLNGYADNMSILGKAKILNAVIPSISTTIEKMAIDFNKKLISTKDTVIDIAGSKANVSAVLENRFTLPFYIKEIELASDSINIDNILKTFNNLFADKTPQPEKKKNKKSKQKENIVIAPAPNPPVIIDKGKIRFDEIVYQNLVAKNAKADFKISSDWNCAAKNISANIADGTINGDLLYNFYTTKVEGNVEAQNVAADTIASTFMNLPNELSGQMDANASFSTKGKTHEELIQNMNGSASFRLNKGRMLRLGSIEYMLRVANTVKGGITRLNLNAIVNLVAPRTGYFDTIEGDFKVLDGIIYSDKVTSRSSELNLFMAGMYNMNNSYVNGTIIGQMPIESKESILWLGSLGRISLNSLLRQLTREAKEVIRENEENFFYNPQAYIDTISDLKTNRSGYRFFVVSLKGNLYEDKYVDDFKWIK
ncbi:MAG: hypothetical protein K6A44_07105 [bacterium]|nr:hypothetical protein [bacterium]